ncbi:MAG: TolC family protein, partial [Gemmatimonadaceae bacterium]|nr:TolC family protein [Chitinophagaceae bacterium]
MQRASKFFAWIGMTALAIPVMAQETHNFSVSQAEEYAKKNSVQVKKALTNVEIQNQTNREITSAAYPQLSGGFTINYFPKVPVQSFPNFISAATYGVLTDEGVKDGSGNAIVAPTDFGFIQAQFGTKYTATAEISGSQLLFDGQVFIGLKARKSVMEFANKQRELTEEMVKANVNKIYWQLVVGKKQMEAFDVNLTTLEKLSNDTKALFENGFREKLDIDKIEVQILNLKTEKERVQNQLTNGYSALKFLLGMPQKDQLTLTDSITEEELKKDILADEFKYTERKDYQLYQIAKRLGDLNVKRYKYAYYPTLAAFGTYNKNAQRNKFDIFNFSKQWFTTALVGVKLSVPIFDGFAKDARVKKAKLELQQTLYDIENTTQTIDNEVEQARVTIRSSLLTMDLQKRNAALAERVYNTEKIKYEQGLGSNLEVINAQAALKTAQINYYASLIDVIIAKVDY